MIVYTRCDPEQPLFTPSYPQLTHLQSHRTAQPNGPPMKKFSLLMSIPPPPLSVQQHQHRQLPKTTGQGRTHRLRSRPCCIPVERRHVDLRVLRPHRPDVGHPTAQGKCPGTFSRGSRGGVFVPAGGRALCERGRKRGQGGWVGWLV